MIASPSPPPSPAAAAPDPMVVTPKSRWDSKSYKFNVPAFAVLLLGSPELIKLAGEIWGPRALEFLALAVVGINLWIRENTGQPLAGSPVDPTKPPSVTSTG